MRGLDRIVTGVSAVTLLLWPTTMLAQGRPIALAVTRADVSTMRAVDQQVDEMRCGVLRLRDSVRDSLMPDRTHQRLDQYVSGVRIAGGDITRQTAADGTVSIFGTMHDASGVNTTAALSAETARQAIGAAVAGVPIGDDPELVVLPLSDGYHLAYRGRAMVDIAPTVVFVDAMTGRELERYGEFISEVGTGTGTYGDTKKVSDTAIGGAFGADDKLRPTEITTYDMKGNLARTTVLFASAGSPSASDVATSSTQTWTDPTVVDAHTDAGMYYDYLYKRFNRHGVDDRDLRIALFTHPVFLGNISRALPSVLETYYINAEYCGTCGPNGRGAVEFGEGAPKGFYAPGDTPKMSENPSSSAAASL